MYKPKRRRVPNTYLVVNNSTSCCVRVWLLWGGPYDDFGLIFPRPYVHVALICVIEIIRNLPLNVLPSSFTFGYPFTLAGRIYLMCCKLITHLTDLRVFFYITIKMNSLHLHLSVNRWHANNKSKFYLDKLCLVLKTSNIFNTTKSVMKETCKIYSEMGEIKTRACVYYLYRWNTP